MENIIKKVSLRKHLTDLNVNDVRRRSCNVVKDSLYQFKRLSTCSWDEFDLSNMENEFIQTEKFNLNQNKFKINLYPSDGQPCCSVTSWDITLMKKIPGKTRKCKIIHKNRSKEINQFTARISVFDDRICLWGTIKDGRENGEEFELTLKTSADRSSQPILHGLLLRGYRKKKQLEQTHDVTVNL